MSMKPHCPSCGQYDDEGHTKECALAAQQQNLAHRERNAAKGKMLGGAAAGQADWQERAASMFLKASVNDIMHDPSELTAR